VTMAKFTYKKSKPDFKELIDEEDEGESGDMIKPDEDFFSMLVDETEKMENDRRLMEQKGHRRYAKVNQRDRKEKTQNDNNEMAYESQVKQHPLLQTQRFDGAIDDSLNPDPPLNSAARADFDNQRREQEMEKQLRLGLMPKFSSAPKPNQP
jgi:hypothetical protein